MPDCFDLCPPAGLCVACFRKRHLAPGHEDRATQAPDRRTRRADVPAVLSDRHRIAFASTRSGDHEIWTCDSEGANCAQLTSMGGPGPASALVPGRSVGGIRHSSRGSGADLQDISRWRSCSPRVVQRCRRTTPSWSHDGKWIYFTSSRSGQWEIWKMPANGGAALQVTTEGGYLPEETSDGRAVYYVKPNKPGLFRAAAEGGAEVQVLPWLPNPQSWALASSGLYFLAAGKKTTMEGAGRPPSLSLLRLEGFRRRSDRTGRRGGTGAPPTSRHVRVSGWHLYTRQLVPC